MENLVSKTWTYDLKDDISGEIANEYVIFQSITMILATDFTERPFRPNIGSPLSYLLGQQMTRESLEVSADQLFDHVESIETRIKINRLDSGLALFPDENAVQVELVYRVIESGKSNLFKKKIFI